jgi:hypothetical protein
MSTPPFSIEEVAISEYPLARECSVFTEYLLGCAATSYVVRKYSDAHQISEVFETGNRFDFLLLRIARADWRMAKVADSYSRVFAPQTLLRKKLVLLLAILETSSPSYRLIDTVEGGSKLLLWIRLAGRGAVSVLSLLLGIAMFFPTQLLMRGAQR